MRITAIILGFFALFLASPAFQSQDVFEVPEELFALSEVFTTGSIRRFFSSEPPDLTPKCTQVINAVKENKRSLLMMIDAWGKPGTAILQVYQVFFQTTFHFCGVFLSRVFRRSCV